MENILLVEDSSFFGQIQANIENMGNPWDGKRVQETPYRRGHQERWIIRCREGFYPRKTKK